MSKKWKIQFALLLLVIGILIGLFSMKNEKNIYQVETNIKETASYVQSISSVVTSSKKLNQLLEEQIKAQEQFFQDQIKDTTHSFLIDREELNIDYQFEIIDDNIWNVSLITSMTGPSFSYPYYRIDCWTWNPKKEKEVDLEGVTSVPLEFSTIRNQVFEELKKECPSCISRKSFQEIFTESFKNFQITEHGVIFYFNPFLFEDDYYDIIPIPLEMNLFSFKRNSQTKEFEQESFVPPSKIIDPKKPVVALTFDDGPSQYTEEIIEILKENEVNATFFILGNKVTAYQEILKRSIQNGNELGNHSYNHQWMSQLSTNQLIEQIEKTQNILKETTGYTPRYLRPTYGSITNRIRKNTELEIALWTVDTRDWKIHNINRIVERATDNIKDGDVILMHDIFERSKEALKKIIPKLKEKGFQFVTMSELEEVKNLRNIKDL